MIRASCIIVTVAACTTATAQNSHTAAGYELEQLACVEKAHTLAESQSCRCEVKARYNRPCDAGVP